MLPPDDRAGVAVWQMSRVTSIVCPTLLHVSEKEGGMAMVRAIARSTTTVCHFMKLS